MAYDVDLHFYGTYSMARFAGIKPEVATKIALGAQWMDESYLSSPTSIMLLPVTGIKKRRLLHFPSQRMDGSLAAINRDGIYGTKGLATRMKGLTDLILGLSGFKEENLNAVAIHTETEEDSPFGSMMISEGLEEGNLMKVAAGIHTLEDSFAHAGTAAEEGHTGLWHWPDRPFFSPDKYFRMTAAVLKVMTAIRAQLPPEALDCQLQIGGDQPNCKLSPEALNRIYSKLPIVVGTVKYDVLKDRSYIRKSLQEFLSRAVTKKYLLPENLPPVDPNDLSRRSAEERARWQHHPKELSALQRLNEILEQTLSSQLSNGRLDAYDFMEMFLTHLYSLQVRHKAKIIDVDFIVQDMRLKGDSTVPIDRYIRSFQTSGSMPADPTGVQPFIRILTNRLLSGFLPRPLDHSHRIETEDDSAIPRIYEMEFRNKAMQSLIQNLYGDKIVFVPNNSGDEVGFWREVMQKPLARPATPAHVSQGQIVATYSLEEKQQFNEIVFQYLFPSLTANDLRTIVKATERWQRGGIPLGLVQTATSVAERGWAAAELGMIARPFISDLLTKRIELTGKERLYTDTQAFSATKEHFRSLNPQLYPQFLGEHDVWTLQGLGLSQ